MTATERPQETSALANFLGILRRRKLVIIQAVILVPLAAGVLSVLQKPLYKGTADVLLSRQSLANVLSGIPDLNAQPLQFQQIQETQAELAHTPDVARQVLAAEHITDESPES